jgi:hypothetical protein
MSTSARRQRTFSVARQHGAIDILDRQIILFGRDQSGKIHCVELVAHKEVL